MEAATSVQSASGGGSFLTEEPAGGAPQSGNPASPAVSNAPNAPAPRDTYLVDMPPELQSAKWATKYTQDGKLNVLGLAKGFEHAQTLIGGEKVAVPKDWSDPEQVDRWYAAAGRPETPEKYEFEPIKEAPEGFYEDEAEKSFRNWAHANGLNQRQAASLRDAYVKTQLERWNAHQVSQKQQREKLETDLRREHGQAYDGFVQTAKAAVIQYADPDFKQYLDESGLGNDPRLIRVFGKIGKELMGENKLKGGPAQLEQTPADLDATITEFRGKHRTALFDKDHPEHNLRVGELNRLYQMRFPEQDRARA